MSGNPRCNGRVLLLAAALLVTTALPDAALSQTGTTVVGSRDDGDSPSALFRQQVAQSAVSGTVAAMEGPIDPEEYKVGPGDLFAISIGGPAPIATTLPVSADGHLLLPGALSIRIADSTLADAVDQATKRLRTNFNNVDVSVVLVSPRQFLVHVVGSVMNPGRHLVLPVSRVSDAVERAFADSVRSAVTNPGFLPSLRNVTVYRRDGSVLNADLTAYYATGSATTNPYLQDGDVVSVPAYDPDRESVSISGHVPHPGKYDFRHGESVRDLVALASGTDPGRVDGQVRVTRWSEQGAEEMLVSLADGGGAEFALRMRDHVFVLPEMRIEGFAGVQGRVRFPGTYAIREGETTIDDLVRMAGGFKPDALLRGAYLERNEWSHTGRLPDPASLNARYLRAVRLSDLDYNERSYLNQELRLQNRVSLDLESGSDETLVLDGDTLVVPRDEHTVFVFGQVTRPGFLPAVSELTVDDYVARAGGRTEQAGETFLIKAGTQQYLEGRTLNARSGDMIFVSRREQLADSPDAARLMMEQDRLALEVERSRSESRFRALGAVLQSVASVASVVALIVTIRNN